MSVVTLAQASTIVDAALKKGRDTNCFPLTVAVPASGHADVARACAPYLRDGQTVLLLPGRTGGARTASRRR